MIPSGRGRSRAVAVLVTLELANVLSATGSQPGDDLLRASGTSIHPRDSLPVGMDYIE